MARWVALVMVATVLLTRPSPAQSCNPTRGGRVALVAGGYAVAQATVILARGDRWWPDPSGTFSFVWDTSPSNGQDRYLHAFAGYQLSQLTTQAWDWTCLPPVTAGWLGAAVSLGFSLSKEIGDGLQPAKGFSGPDMMAATAGAVLPALHRQFLVSRALLLKFNYWPSEELGDPAANLSLASDYAGQRYFLAINPGRLPTGAGAWPDWLGVAVGHSVQAWILEPAEHEWYVTLDLNARGLPVQAGWWQAFATVLDQFHIPLPGIRIRTGELAVGLF